MRSGCVGLSPSLHFTMLTALRLIFPELTLSSGAATSAEESAAPLPLLECGICFEAMDAAQTHVCTDCGARFCLACMGLYIDSKVQDGLVTSQHLTCPASACVHVLSESRIQAIASSVTFQKYKTFLKSQAIGVRYCPSATCSAALQEPRHSRRRHVKCASCRLESCMRCGQAFHKLPICRGMNMGLHQWKKVYRKDARSCPKCMILIEKNGGCPHMTCAHCEHQYCWICMRPWNKHSRTWCKWKAFL